MKTMEKDGKLIIALDGRIDTNNALDTENALLAELEAHSGAEPVFDAESLDYISSAGLRVLMKIRKICGKPIAVENVSREVYEIFKTTGFTDLLDVKKALRRISVDGCEKIGQGGNGTVYRLDEDKIVKVYKPWMKLREIEEERIFAKTAFVNGIPSVIAYDTVKVGDCLGIVFELINSDTLGHAMTEHPEKLEEYTDAFTELAKKLHSTHVPKGSFASIKDVGHNTAENLKDICTPEEVAAMHRIIDSIPESDTVVHNDLHPGNIMIQNGELLLIDMQAVTTGPPICDLIGTFRDMIMAPDRSGELMQMTVGMPPELIKKAGNLFFMKYTGITDPKELEAYYKKLGLLYAFNISQLLGRNIESVMKRKDVILEHVLRKIVIPNEQVICGLYRSM